MRLQALLIVGIAFVSLKGIGIARAQHSPSVQRTTSGKNFDCIILPIQLVEIRSSQVGLIEKLHAQRGETVSKGDILVTLESNAERTATEANSFRAKAQGNLSLAKAKESAAQAKARRLWELHQEDYVSAQAKDDAEAEYKLAQSEVKVAEEALSLAKIEHQQSINQLERRVLRSPISGVVMDVNGTMGALAEPGDGKKPIMRVAQINILKVEASVPLQFFKDFAIGSEVTVVPEAPFDKAFSARVKLRDRVIDPAAGTFGFIAEMDNREHTLPGGLRCKFALPR